MMIASDLVKLLRAVIHNHGDVEVVTGLALNCYCRSIESASLTDVVRNDGEHEEVQVLDLVTTGSAISDFVMAYEARP